MTIAVAIGTFVVLLLLSVPISFAIGLAAVAAAATLWSVDNTIVVQQMVAAVNSFPLLAVIFFNLSLGLITPPVGTSLFVGCRIAGLPITAVVRPMLPLVAIRVSVLLLMTYFPQLYMWLPRSFGFV